MCVRSYHAVFSVQGEPNLRALHQPPVLGEHSQELSADVAPSHRRHLKSVLTSATTAQSAHPGLGRSWEQRFGPQSSGCIPEQHLNLHVLEGEGEEQGSLGCLEIWLDTRLGKLCVCTEYWWVHGGLAQNSIWFSWDAFETFPKFKLVLSGVHI